MPRGCTALTLTHISTRATAAAHAPTCNTLHRIAGITPLCEQCPLCEQTFAHGRNSRASEVISGGISDGISEKAHDTMATRHAARSLLLCCCCLCSAAHRLIALAPDVALRCASVGAAVSRGGAIVACANGSPLLEVENLCASVSEGAPILNGVDLTVRRGEVHAIMGPNGSGKSTLSKVLVGHPAYEVTSGGATFDGEDLLDLEPEERAQQGVFLAFQYPVEIPGVANVDFLRLAVNKRRGALGQARSMRAAWSRERRGS